MSAAAWSLTPYTVHVNRDPAGAVTRAKHDGALVIDWPLKGIRNWRELDDSAAAVFEFPSPSATLDGIIDFASDLEWLDISHGVVFVIDAAGARPSIARDVASILPFIGDRFRSGSKTFEAYLVGVEDVAAALDELESSNASLDESGRTGPRPDTYRVPVDAPDSPRAVVTAPRRHPILRWSRRGA